LVIKKIEKVVIENDKKELNEIEVDSVLAFFGLKMELGPIINWGLNLENKTIVVNTENFETNEKGIFAVGDICSYPGKLKLILSGFHEAALAAQACFKRAKPDEKYVFRFTTSSSDIHKRLGIK
jgi:thioredoxin reductase (NADPH)